MKRSLPLGSALGGAVAFLPRAWANAWGVLILAAVLLAAPAWAHQLPHLAKVWIHIPLAIGGLAVGLALRGALYRLGTSSSVAEARRAGLGIGGLQFGWPELRMFAAAILVALFLAVAALGLGLVFAFILNVEGIKGFDPAATLHAAQGGEAGAIVLCGVAAASAWIILQLAVRLSLFRAATVARGRIVSIGAMSLAQGAFWRLFLGLVVVMIPSLVLGAWEGGLLAPGWVMPMSSRVYAVARAVFLAGVQVPLVIGFLSYAYNRLEYRT